MSNFQLKQRNFQNIVRQDNNVQELQEQLLLQKTQQKITNNKRGQSKQIHEQKEQTQEVLKQYVKIQHSNIKLDNQDLHNLQNEIERIKKIKTQYKEQKQEIEHLNKIVSTLKSQNRSLKFEKQSMREESQRKQSIDEFQKKHKNKRSEKDYIQETNQKTKGYNKLKGNIVNVDKQLNLFELQNETAERYLSPQVGRRIIGNCFKPTGLRHDRNQSYNHQIFKPDQQTIIRTHHNNKRTIIATFVQQLKQQLQQNELVLHKQRKSHRQTKQTLQICLQQLSDLRLRLQKYKNYQILQRENYQIKKQLQIEVQQRLLAQQKLREKQYLLKQYESTYMTNFTDFDVELDKMDQIYFSVQKTLKI